MITALQSIKEKLLPLSINISNDTITFEIMTYASELQKIYDELDKIENEMFISTANDYGLIQRENILDMTLTETDITKRQKSLLFREMLISNPQNKTNTIKALSAYGIECTIIENFNDNIITVQVTNTDSLTNTQKYYTDKIKNTLPINSNIIIKW